MAAEIVGADAWYLANPHRAVAELRRHQDAIIMALEVFDAIALRVRRDAPGDPSGADKRQGHDPLGAVAGLIMAAEIVGADAWYLAWYLANPHRAVAELRRHQDAIIMALEVFDAIMGSADTTPETVEYIRRTVDAIRFLVRRADRRAIETVIRRSAPR